jgi:hypothetical protein
VCSKKSPKGTKKGAQHLTLLTKLKGKKPSTKHVPCTVDVTDEDLVKSTMKLNDSDAMLSFVAWGSDEDLRYITMFSEVLSIDPPMERIEKRDLCWYYLALTATGKTSQRCVRSSLQNVSGSFLTYLKLQYPH